MVKTFLLALLVLVSVTFGVCGHALFLENRQPPISPPTMTRAELLPELWLGLYSHVDALKNAKGDWEVAWEKRWIRNYQNLLFYIMQPEIR